MVKFDKLTRTLTVAIRIAAANALADDSRKLPLVEGMFCIVEIPGRTLHNVIAVPQWAVSFKNTVYLAADNHLKTLPVTVVHKADNQAYISTGLNVGDIVITTRLTDPLENALVEIIAQEE